MFKPLTELQTLKNELYWQPEIRQVRHWGRQTDFHFRRGCHLHRGWGTSGGSNVKARDKKMFLYKILGENGELY